MHRVIVFTDFNMISSIGGFLFGASQLIFVYVIIDCIKGGTGRVTAEVWEGHHGLEFRLPSPPPYHTWETPPEIAETRV